jgi:hypothetical protein
MSRVLITAAVLLCLSQASLGQDFRDDLRFAEALRDRGDLDLALELLNRLDKNATPEQKKNCLWNSPKPGFAWPPTNPTRPND